MLRKNIKLHLHLIRGDLGFSNTTKVRGIDSRSISHRKGITMSVRLLSLSLAVGLLPFAVGCGFFRGLCHGPGAACNACAVGNPNFSPTYPGPTAGCGLPGCGPVHGPELGCGGETISSYYGGNGDPGPANSIGGIGYGVGYNGGVPYDANNPDNWLPQEYVPGALRETEGLPTAPLSPTPAGS